MRGSVLIIDDNPDILEALKVVLEDEFSEVVTERNPNRIPALLGNKPDVILLDMNFSAGINSGNEGLFWLSKIREANSNAFIVLMTAYGNVDLAVEALKRGASDFILKPWNNDKLIATVRAGRQRKTALSITPSSSAYISAQSSSMKILEGQVEKVAATDATVLILGENGTGKEVIARRIHELSKRRNEKFSTVDMSAITPSLFESELFGHKKGAFTDAKADRIGKFVEANRGTLFLDEIGNLPLPQQAKTLTVLEAREVTPLGSNERIPFDVRIIAATNASLSSMVANGEFRQDLFYRLNTITIEVPPLRARAEDIPTLTEYFLQRYSTLYQKDDLKISAAALELLSSYTWPGNIRELQHTIEKGVILSDGKEVTPKDLNLSISAKPLNQQTIKTLDEIEKDALIDSLRIHQGNIVQAAKALGITRQTLYNKMKKYGL